MSGAYHDGVAARDLPDGQPAAALPTSLGTARGCVGPPLWAAAKASGARYVISQNTRDYPPSMAGGRHVYDGIEYLGGDAFLHLLAGTDLE